MNVTPEVEAWLAKAEADYRVATRELAVLDESSYDSVFYHCQQCVEKYLKALLVAHQQLPPRTHDLLQLVGALLPYYPDWKAWLEEDGLYELNQGSAEIRYPGATTSYELATELYVFTERFRFEIQSVFPINQT